MFYALHESTEWDLFKVSQVLSRGHMLDLQLELDLAARVRISVHCLQAICPRAGCVIFPCFHFLIYKIDNIIYLILLFQRLKGLIYSYTKNVEQYLAYKKAYSKQYLLLSQSENMKTESVLSLLCVAFSPLIILLELCQFQLQFSIMCAQSEQYCPNNQMKQNERKSHIVQNILVQLY